MTALESIRALIAESKAKRQTLILLPEYLPTLEAAIEGAGCEALSACRERLVRMVMDASLSTGHADTAEDLMQEVIDQVLQLRGHKAATRGPGEKGTTP